MTAARRTGPAWFRPQGRDLEHELYQYKLEWLARLRRYFDRHFTARQSVVWVGDLNVAPTALDVHNAGQQANHVCYHEAVRRAFAAALDWGFVGEPLGEGGVAADLRRQNLQGDQAVKLLERVQFALAAAIWLFGGKRLVEWWFGF